MYNIFIVPYYEHFIIQLLLSYIDRQIIVRFILVRIDSLLHTTDEPRAYYPFALKPISFRTLEHLHSVSKHFLYFVHSYYNYL